MEKKSRFVHIYTIFLFLLVMAILVVHTFLGRSYNIDYTTVLLLVILILFPYLPKFRKLKLGDFEAEIAPSEITKIEKKISKVKPLKNSEGKFEDNKYLNKIIKEILALAKSKPELALVKLRIELEKVTTKLYLTFFGQNAVTKVSTSKKISRLLDNKEDHKEYFEAAIEIISICNRAAHGEKIDNPTTIKTLLLGIEILSYFYGMLQGYMDALAGS